MKNDKYIVDLILANVHFYEPSIKRVITKRLCIYKRKKIDNIHQNNLVDILLKIQKHYYGNMMPLYYTDGKLNSKLITSLNKNKKILNTLISSLNKYRIKHWHWESIDVSQLY